MWHTVLIASCPNRKCDYVWENKEPQLRATEDSANADTPQRCPICKGELEVYGIEVGDPKEFGIETGEKAS